MKTRIAVIVAVFGLTLAGCGTCEEGEVRCDGAVAQSCDGLDWEDEHDCGAEGLTCGTGDACGALGSWLAEASGSPVACCY